MSKRVFLVVAFLLVLIFGLGLFFGILGAGLAFRPGKGTFYNTSTVLQQVQTLSHLVTVKYVMEKVVILEDPPQNPVRRLLPDETRVVLVAHGVVKAGIDLGKLREEDIKITGKKLKLSLPPAQITDAYLEENQTKIIERNTSFLRDFNKDLEQAARQNAVEDIRRAARTSGILKDANDRAREQLIALFRLMGFETVEISAP